MIQGYQTIIAIHTHLREASHNIILSEILGIEKEIVVLTKFIHRHTRGGKDGVGKGRWLWVA
jgi:hypothetical protein